MAFDPIGYLTGAVAEAPATDNPVAWRAYAVSLEQKMLLGDPSLRPTEAARAVVPRVIREFTGRFGKRDEVVAMFNPGKAQRAPPAS